MDKGKRKHAQKRLQRGGKMKVMSTTKKYAGQHKNQREGNQKSRFSGPSASAAAPGGQSKDDVVQNQRYWDSMAKKYDKEIYDSFNEAINRDAILAILDQVANPMHTCIDYGCGVGKYLAALSSRFNWVYGFDLSQALLDKAMETVVWTGSGRSRQRRLKNVTLAAADLGKEIKLSKPLLADFGCCQNVLLEPDQEVVRKMLHNIWQTLKPGAHLMLLVPSLESALHVGQMDVERLQKAMSKCDGCSVVEGRLPREGVLTQYYLQDHIHRLLAETNFTPISTTRLEYNWSHEFGVMNSHHKILF